MFATGPDFFKNILVYPHKELMHKPLNVISSTVYHSWNLKQWCSNFALPLNISPSHEHCTGSYSFISSLVKGTVFLTVPLTAFSGTPMWFETLSGLMSDGRLYQTAFSPSLSIQVLSPSFQKFSLLISCCLQLTYPSEVHFERSIFWVLFQYQNY